MLLKEKKLLKLLGKKKMKQTKIEWTEATWNPTNGCDKVSAGCRFCYAETMARRLQAMGTKGYENGFEFTIVPERLEKPLHIKKQTKFFVNSMSDLFHENMPEEYLNQIFEIIRATPQHTYQILTKREKRMYDFLKDKELYDNIWLGVTVENKKAKKRIDYLRDINAKIKFISAEPLLEDLGDLNLDNIHWVIVGGESGHKARPMDQEWALNIQRQCDSQDVSFFFKQWGTWGADGIKRSKKSNGRELVGKTFDEYPELNEEYYS